MVNLNSSLLIDTSSIGRAPQLGFEWLHKYIMKFGSELYTKCKNGNYKHREVLRIDSVGVKLIFQKQNPNSTTQWGKLASEGNNIVQIRYLDVDRHSKYLGIIINGKVRYYI